MARGVNKVILIGNLGADPEVRYLPSGGAVTNLSVATSESWKDKTTGQLQTQTEWHRVSMFNRLAEIAGEYLRKGSKVYIEGSLRTRKWQDKNGVDRYSTDIIGSEMQMLDSKGDPRDSAPGGFDDASNGGFQSQQTAYASSGAKSSPAPMSESHADMDDDIPF